MFKPTAEEMEKYKVNPIVNLDNVYEDERGWLLPLTDRPTASAVLIQSKKGTVRANHWHKTDWHYCHVLEGKIEYHFRPVGSTQPASKVVIKKGQLFFTPPDLEHAMVFMEDTVFLTLAGSSRDQAAYEADVVRVNLV